MQHKMSKIQFLVALLAVIYFGPSYNTCPLNQWCRPAIHDLDSEYKFIVKTQTESISWFDALQLCHNEGREAKLFSLESAAEREWLHSQLKAFNSFEPTLWETDEYDEGTNLNLSNTTVSSSLWLVNAHLHLYHLDAPAWAAGRPINASLDREAALPVRLTLPKNCSRPYTHLEKAEAECFAIRMAYTNSDMNDERMELVNLQCTAARTSRAICKRSLFQKQVNASNGLLNSKFNASLWIKSPTDDTLYYRILNLDNECIGNKNWYCARLLCMKYEATLTNIEDHREFEWLREQIEKSYERENVSGERTYFVNLHRFLYNTSMWTWNGSPKMSFFLVDKPVYEYMWTQGGYANARPIVVNLQSVVPPNPCEQRLCARISDADGPQEYARLSRTYCGATIWKARAVCKKRVVDPELDKLNNASVLYNGQALFGVNKKYEYNNFYVIRR